MQCLSLGAMAYSLNHAFGQSLQELRHERGVTQEALGFACGRHRTTVTALEAGEHSPTLDTVWMLAAGLGVSPTELVRRIERLGPAVPPPPPPRATTR